MTSGTDPQLAVRLRALGRASGWRRSLLVEDNLGFVEAARQLGLYWLVLNETPPGAGRLSSKTAKTTCSS